MNDFLTSTQIQQYASAAGLEQAVIAQLVALAERISGEPTLQRCAEQLFAQTYAGAELTIEPTAETLLGAEANKLYLLLAVAALPQLWVAQQARGIPAAITREIFGALPTAARRFAEWHSGQVGLEAWVLRYWFNEVASGHLHRLGRLEFILGTFDCNLRVYRHRQSGRVQALAEAGLQFAVDGYLPFEYDEITGDHYGWRRPERTAEGWTASLVETEESITGTPISPCGYALRTMQQLAKAEWELVFANGDTVLDIHIPNFMPLQLDLLHKSLQRALDFFPCFYQDRPFKAFVCSSWIFNTQLREMLAPNSNLLAFQRQGYLFPLPSDGADGLYFLFGDWLIDLDKAPRDTQLQRAVIKHLKAGDKLRSGGFFLLPDAVEQFGQAPYQSGECI